MIALGYNGFSNTAAFADAYFGSRGIDRNLLTGHDAGAALFRDGILIAAAEEERFTRCKKTSAFPKNAITYCLKEAGCSLREVEHIALPWDFSEQWICQQAATIFQGDGSFSDKLANFERQRTFYLQVGSHEQVIRDFNSRMGTVFGPERFVFVPHHLAHMFCGFFLSEMQDAAFLVTDGRGEGYSSLTGEICKNNFKLFHQTGIADSIGILYRKFTRYLGFTPNSDEWKVMALGAFADPTPKYAFDQFIELLPEGKFRIKLPEDGGHTAYYRFFAEQFGAEKDEATLRTLAYVIQDITEKVLRHQVDHLQKQTAYDRLFIEGGVALNCVNNSKLLTTSHFKDIQVSFAANDTGTCIGAAFFPFYEKKLFQANPVTPYLGPTFTKEAILKALEARTDQLSFRELSEEELVEEVAQQLAEKKIIGWFQARMEFGPRALGNRSILANPAFPDMKDIINAKVKYREPFRPFAGIMTKSDAAEYFDLGKKATSPFMTFVFPAKQSAKEKAASALHVDGTSRLQTLSASQNPKLHKLLVRFKAKTGTACLINTSFNIQGEPIVCTPEDAISCFLKSGIDILVLDNFLVLKKRKGAIP